MQDSSHEIGRRAIVDWNNNDSFEQAAPQRCHPLRPVFAPEQDLIALCDACAAQPSGKDSSRAGDIGIAVAPATVAIVIDQKFLRMAGQLCEEIEESLHLLNR